MVTAIVLILLLAGGVGGVVYAIVDYGRNKKKREEQLEAREAADYSKLAGASADDTPKDNKGFTAAMIANTVVMAISFIFLLGMGNESFGPLVSRFCPIYMMAVGPLLLFICFVMYMESYKHWTAKMKKISIIAIFEMIITVTLLGIGFIMYIASMHVIGM